MNHRKNLAMHYRPRRMRQHAITREMTAETRLSINSLMYPCFLIPGSNKAEPVAAMPGISRYTADRLAKHVEPLLAKGLNKLLLFGTGDAKTETGSSAADPHSSVNAGIAWLKKEFGNNLYLVTDVCLCAYTTHGHCGVVKDDYVQNDLTLPLLSAMALSHVQSGADMVAPSDMMDGRVAAIRSALDGNGYSNTPIMSYSTKFASAYYGPFREAAGSAPGKGDRRSYQMDVRNAREALHESLIDEAEGADVLMVKPALAYLDIIKTLRENTLLPIACYNVSAEYSMVKSAAAAGYIDEEKMVMENMIAFARAGAGLIITYHAPDIVNNNWMQVF